MQLKELLPFLLADRYRLYNATDYRFILGGCHIHISDLPKFGEWIIVAIYGGAEPRTIQIDLERPKGENYYD